MNSYAKVRAPNSNKSKSNSDKPQPKQTEISVNIKQPFKISRPGIEQPKMKMNHAPSVVHIVQRKASKMDQSKYSSQSERIRIIEPSSAKKGWKFNLNDDFQDQHLQPNINEQKSRQKLMNAFPQEKIQVPSVNLVEKEESLSNPTARVAYQRHLQRAISHSSIRSSQSIVQDSSVHHLDFGQPIKIQSIDIQQVVEIYRNTDQKALQRNLVLNNQWIPQKQGKIKSSLIPDERSPIQVYQINEQYNMPSDKIRLKRNVELINDFNIFDEPQQFNFEQHRESRSSLRNSMIVIQDNEGKLRQILIPQQIQESRKENMVKNQVRRMWVIENTEKINDIFNQKQDVFIGQDYQQYNSKIEMSNHKRFMSHSQVIQKQIKVQSSPIQRPLSQSVNLKSIEEEFYNKTALRQPRKLVVVEDNTGNHQIFIPEQFQQSRSQISPLNQKRSVNPSNFSEDHPIKASIIPRSLSESVHLQSIQEGFYDDKRQQKLQRKLLILENKDGSQEIFVPEQTQYFDRERNLINHHRDIISSHIQEQKPIRVSNRAPSSSQRIDLQSLHQGFNHQKRFSSKLQRKLVNIDDSKGLQLIFIPEQSQAFGQQKISSSHRRTITNSQAFQKKPQRVSYASSVPQKIKIQSLNENWEDENRSSKCLRKIILVEDNRNKSQNIFISEQMQKSRQSVSINHIRNMSHSLQQKSALKQGSIDLYSIQEGLRDSKPSSKNIRNLLIRQESVGEQQIFINEQLQRSNQDPNVANHRRTLVNGGNFNPKQDKISSRPLDAISNQQKIEVSQVFEQIDSKERQSRLSRKLLVLQEKNGKIKAQQINISGELEYSQKNKSLQSHKRAMNHIHQANQKQGLAQYQNVQIGSLEQRWGSDSKNSRLLRKLLVLQGNNGQLLAQQIVIPEELQQSHNKNDVNSHKRELRLMKLQQEPKVGSKSFSNIDIEEQQFQPSSHNESKLRMCRNIFLIKEESGKQIYQQVIIPEDFEVKQAKISNIHYKRKIVNEFEPQMQKQERIRDSLPQNDEIQYEQVMVNSDLQQRSSQRFVQSHRRTVKHLQVLPQVKKQPKVEKISNKIIEEPFNDEPVQIQQIFEDYSSKSQKTKQARNLFIVQQPNGNVFSQQIIIPEQFSQNNNQKYSKLEHKRQFKIINFQDEVPFNQQKPISNEIAPIDNIVINSVEEDYNHSKKSQKVSRNLLAIQNSKGQTLYQEIFLPNIEESSLRQSAVDSHKRQIKITELNDSLQYQQPYPLQQQEEKTLKINSYPVPQVQQINVDEIHQDINRSDNKINPKFKRALLLAKNQNGEVISQQIQIPDQQFQMDLDQKPLMNYQRNIKPQNKTSPVSQPPHQQSINIPEQIYMKNVEKVPMNYKRQIKSQLKAGKGIPSESVQISQDLHDEGSRNQIHPEKSFNPSTLNSSQAPNINFTTSLEQSRVSPEHQLLGRSLAPCPEKLSQSEHSNNPQDKLFDVYNPRAYLDSRLLASQRSLPTPIHNLDKPLKPHRRPGFH